MNEGLIFADGRMLTAVEAAAYIKELKEENELLKKEVSALLKANQTLQLRVLEKIE